MTTAYLIHGTSTRDDDWFPWLEEALAPAVKLERLWLPDPFAPTQAAWDSALEDQIKPADGLTLVAHSLGCVTALRYLARHPEIKGANLVLVGAFVDPLPTYPSLDAYMAGELDLKALQPQLHRATVIVAKDDYVTPYQLGVAVAKGLGAKLIVQDRGGHFLTSDGCEQFPLVLKEVGRVMG